MLPFFVSLIVFFFAIIHPVLAAEINLTVTQKSLTDSVVIVVTNSSINDVIIESVEIELNQKKYNRNVREAIKAGAARDFIFSLETPDMQGSYILKTTLRYWNDGALLTVKHADFYHFGRPALLSESCSIETFTGGEEGRIRLKGSPVYSWRLVVPDEFEAKPAGAQGNILTYRVIGSALGFTTMNQIFGASEAITGNVHRAALCSAILTIDSGSHSADTSWLPGYVFIIFAAIFYAVSGIIVLAGNQSHVVQIMFRYGSRMFFLSICCFALKEMGGWLTLSVHYLTWGPYQGLARFLLDNIKGGNYRYFFQFFIDGYFVLCLIFIFPCLYRFDSQGSAVEDKYATFFTTFFTLPKLMIGKRPFWNSLAKLGFLTIMVKSFFTPVMVSWAIAGVYNVWNGLHLIQWNVYAINAYLVQLLILVDTFIFSLGYLIESKYLKNEIKSVDPTFFGWLVCLLCYPPFNSFAFKPFDYYIIRINLPNPAWLNVVVLCLITFLWAIFVWASVALGFKASNLTNRGVVNSGPYRFVRHPAYMAKLVIWILQGVFFAQFGIFILLGFIIVYVLRAWTEERHLSRDPDYLAYKQSVRWWFIPGVI